MEKWPDCIRQALGALALGVVILLSWAGCSPRPDDPASPAVAAMLDLVRNEGDPPTQAELWQRVKQLSQAEIEEAVEAVANMEKREEWYSELPDMLFYRWAQHDPVAAHKKVDPMYPKYFAGPYQAVITAWINQGGEKEAWAAIQHEGEMWACTQSIRSEVAEMIAVSWNDLSHEEAFKKAAQVGDHNCLIASYLCDHREGEAWKTPESRAAFIAAAAEYPEDYVLRCARESLYRAWAEVDLEAAKLEISSLAISEEERESLLDWLERDIRYDKKKPISNSSEGKPWHQLKQGLLKQWKASPSVRHDYDLREATLATLHQAPIEHLEGWAAEPVDAGWDHYYENVPERLREFIIVNLATESYARIIPVLLAHANEEADELANEVIYLWMERDPASLYDWLVKTRPETDRKDTDWYLEDALLELAEKDRAAFDLRLKKADPKLRTEVLDTLEWRARKAASQ